MIKTEFPLPSRDVLEKRYRAAFGPMESILNDLVKTLSETAKERNINVTVRHRVKSFNSWYAKLLKTASTKKN